MAGISGLSAANCTAKAPPIDTPITPTHSCREHSAKYADRVASTSSSAVTRANSRSVRPCPGSRGADTAKPRAYSESPRYRSVCGVSPPPCTSRTAGAFARSRMKPAAPTTTPSGVYRCVCIERRSMARICRSRHISAANAAIPATRASIGAIYTPRFAGHGSAAGTTCRY